MAKSIRNRISNRNFTGKGVNGDACWVCNTPISQRGERVTPFDVLDAVKGSAPAGQDMREKNAQSFADLSEITSWYEAKLKEQGVL